MSRSSQHNNNNNNSTTGSESGWTMYLDQSSVSSYQYPQRSSEGYEEDEEGDVDLSMVSDASSGPPHDPHEDDQDDEYCRKSEKESKKLGKKKKKKMMMMSKQMCQHNQSLDDTASSPPIHSLSQKQRGVKGSDEHGSGSNARQSKGKSTSVGQSYSRSSVK